MTLFLPVLELCVCVCINYGSPSPPQHTHTQSHCVWIECVCLHTCVCVCGFAFSLSFFLCSILPKTLHKRSVGTAHKAKPLRGWDFRDIIRGDYREGGHRSVLHLESRRDNLIDKENEREPLLDTFQESLARFTHMAISLFLIRPLFLFVAFTKAITLALVGNFGPSLLLLLSYFLHFFLGPLPLSKWGGGNWPISNWAKEQRLYSIRRNICPLQMYFYLYLSYLLFQV